jgi:hypothetical protein
MLRLARSWWRTRQEATGILAALSVCAAVTLHAFIDFSLEIQAVALYVACLIGLAIGESMAVMALSSERKEIHDPTAHEFGFPARHAQTDMAAG